MKYVVKVAGPETVISDRVEADSFRAVEGIVVFEKEGPAGVFKTVLTVGASRLISIRPES